MINLEFGAITGLSQNEAKQLAALADVFNSHQSANAVKDKYYEGHISLQDVNIGIALPGGIRNLEVGCSWGQKTVDVLAARSMFDGFVGKDTEVLTRLVADNCMVTEYAKACRDELKYGCVFATLSADRQIGCKIRFHSPATAAALWNGEKGRIDCGLAVIDTVPDEKYRAVAAEHRKPVHGHRRGGAAAREGAVERPPASAPHGAAPDGANDLERHQ